MNQNGICEQWKPVNGYDGLYLVSNKGRVAQTRFRAGSREYPEKRIKSLNDNGNGYMQVSFCHRNFYVHRLVADAFIDNPNSLDQVHHLDGNPKNNSVENLAWVTSKENVHHARRQMRHPKSISKESATKSKYVLLRVGSDGDPRYRVYIRQLRFCKQYRTLEEAIRARDEVMKSHGL